MTTATHLQLVQLPATPEKSERPTDARVRHFGRWSLMNRRHFAYVTDFWWQMGYRAGAAAAQGEQR